jgi:hypothetical protein
MEKYFMLDRGITFYDRTIDQDFMLDRGTTFYDGQWNKIL